ncbi:helix-turn-helix domain-containing protein [Candidatus Roizmanbacteria bacterium]|nr:helix-turn-helix domain-containing protein [Candidatus Roizmanbacteria bacterium]
MSKRRTYSISNLPKGKTDWDALSKLTDAEINKAALSDEDAKPLTKAQLAKFKRVHPVGEVDVKRIREKSHMTQEAFAAYFGISKRTLQEWEQGRRLPQGAARTLLIVILYEPIAVQRALLHQHKH